MTYGRGHQRVKGTGPSWKKLSNIPELYAKMFENVLLRMSVIPPPQKKMRTCEILRFKVFGPMTSFGLRFYFNLSVFAAKELRRTTSACYRLGYCYALVDRVYEPECYKRPQYHTSYVKE